MGVFRRIFGLESKPAPAPKAAADEYISPPNTYGGEKFPGGLQGQIDDIKGLDYWTLRERSANLFNFNSYAKGIVRRLVTNVINTGLTLEATPEETILGLDEDSLVDWAENIENRFSLWCDSPDICDAKGYRKFGGLQRSIYREAIIEGDCLVIIRQDLNTNLPQLQIVSGSRVCTPPNIDLIENNSRNVVDGVVLDGNGKHLGYWVYNGTDEVADDTYTYIPAYGRLTSRRQAWLVYGFDKREDGVRGAPLLSVAIQPLHEIDRYRDSAQRKAYINSMIVGFIKRTNVGPGSMPIQGGAIRKTTMTATEPGTANPVTVAEILPGVFMERLEPGEEPAPYSINGADVNFSGFEAAIMVGIAWALEIPPEILLLSFNKNYSASQAAINEFKILLNRERARFGGENNDHIYKDWFLSELLLGKIEAPGLIEAMSDPKQYDIRKAWLIADWSGAIKPATDLVKQANGYKAMVDEAWITNERAARELTGTKFSKNIRRLKKENEMKIEAAAPLMEAEQAFGPDTVARALGLSNIGARQLGELVDLLRERMEENDHVVNDSIGN